MIEKATGAAQGLIPSAKAGPIQVKPVRLSENYSQLLKRRPVAHSDRLKLHANFQPALAGFSLGVLVPKRLVKRAVDRNLIKRLVRMAVLQHCRNSCSDRAVLLVRLVKPVQSIPHGERRLWIQEIHHLLGQAPWPVHS